MTIRLFFCSSICSILLLTRAPADELSMVPSVESVADYPAGQPIPTSEEVPTQKQFSAIARQWFDRTIVSAYRAAHPGDEEAPKFLAESLTYLLKGDSHLQKRLSEQAARLAQAGIDDPAFYLMAGVVRTDAAQKERYLTLALSAFPQSRYPRFFVFIAAANLSRSLFDRKASEEQIAATDRVALDGLRSGLADASFLPDEMPALRWRLCSDSTTSLLKRRSAEACEIFASAGHAPEWIRELGQGQAYLLAAWKARTGGWSSEVTEDGWAGWRLNLPKAREHYTKAWSANPRDPEAAASMIEVAMGDGASQTEMRAWFDRAVAAQMDYYDAYRALIWALRPRWRGSHEAMLQLGDECLRTERFDTCVPNYYFKVVRDVASEESTPRSTYEQPAIRNNLRWALARYFVTPEMPLRADFAHTLTAILDYQEGKFTELRAQMQAINFEPATDLGPGLDEDFHKMIRAIPSP